MKYAWIEEHCDQFSVTRMCRQFGVSRSGYCQWRTRAPSSRSMANAALDAQVAAIHAGSKRSYGRPRIVRGLREQGVQVGHERVRHSLKRQGLRPVYKRPYRVTTDSAHHKPIAPNVLDRRFDGWRINQAWVADITYIDTDEGWLYLACVMDLASRRIVGWSMSDRIKADLVCQASGGPCIYRGKEMKAAHAGMGISNAEFDAVVDDLVQTINKYKVGEREKNELLSLLAPMRTQIVEAP